MRSSAVSAALLAVLAGLLAGCGTTSAAPRHEPEQGGGPTGPPAQQHRPRGWPAPVEMHSLTAPAPPGSNRAATYGLGDLDGDGRSDMVQVRTDGLVTAELTWLGHRSVRLRPDPTLRLQALPDLDGDGRAEVLVASTAVGCCRSFTLPDTRSAVLVLDHGRLRPLRWDTGGPATLRFDRGRGDMYAGVRCDGHALHLVAARTDGANAVLTDTTVAISGDLAHREPAEQRTIAADTARAETRSRCPGLDAQGWAG